jgi:hypothetical protein
MSQAGKSIGVPLTTPVPVCVEVKNEGLLTVPVLTTLPENVGPADKTLLPVPVFVTLTSFLFASVATAEDAVR